MVILNKLDHFYFRLLIRVVVQYHLLALSEKNILLTVMKIVLQENKKKQKLLETKKFGLQN